MTKKIGREERLQRSVAAALVMCRPENVVWYAVPNSPRNPVAGARLKAMGMRAGVADLAFVIEGQAFFIELKVEKSHEGGRTYLEPEQRQFRDDVQQAGGYFALCRSLDEVMRALRGWGVELQNWKW